MIKKNQRTRMAAFVYDVYNRTQLQEKFSMIQLCRYHCVGSRFSDIVQARKMMASGRGSSARYTWLGEPPTDALIEELMKEHHRQNNEHYRQAQNEKSVEQKAVHHQIAPGFTYVDLTGENPPEKLEQQPESPDPVQVAPVIDTKLMEQYVKAHMLEIMTKMFGNEKDTAGNGA
jgi:hypothetical protein